MSTDGTGDGSPSGRPPFIFQFRVGYADTDKMGFLHHGRFLVHMESARTEALRSTGESYLSWENRGILLPLTGATLAFQKPAFYDDLVTIAVRMAHVTRLRLGFTYEFTRPRDGALLATGSTEHVFMNPDLRPIRLDQDSMDRLLTIL